MPSPSHHGWYVEPTTGTNACHQRMSTNESTTAVTTWAPSSRRPRSDTLRCSDWLTNAGTPRPARPEVASTPSAVAKLRTPSSTNPVLRLKYQRRGASIRPAPPTRSGSTTGQLADQSDAGAPDQSCGDPTCGEPGRSLATQDDRRRRGGVRRHAGGSGGRDRRPHLDRRLGGARVQQVMATDAVPRPVPHPGGRGREAATVEADQHVRRVVGVGRHGDRPRLAAGAGDRDVPTEADDRRPESLLLGQGSGDQVRGPGLGGAAQVERRVPGDAHSAVVQLDVAPVLRAGRLPDLGSRRGLRRVGQQPQVPVVAQLDEPVAEQRVDQPVRPVRRLEGGANGSHQEGVDLHPGAGVPVDPAQVGVLAEAAAGLVDVAEHESGDGFGGGEVRVVPGGEEGVGPEGLEAGRGHVRTRRSGPAPAEAGAGAVLAPAGRPTQSGPRRREHFLSPLTSW